MADHVRTQSQGTVAGTATTILAANPDRKGWYLSVLSTSAVGLYYRFHTTSDTTDVSSSNGDLVGVGDKISLNGQVEAGALQAIGNGGTATYYVREW